MRDYPAVHLPTITERYWEGILGSEPIINTEHYHVLLLQHIGPLDGIIGVLEAFHAHEGAAVEVYDHLLDAILKILLRRRIRHSLNLVRVVTTRAAGHRALAHVTFVIVLVDHVLLGLKGELARVQYSYLYAVSLSMTSRIPEEVHILPFNGLFDDRGDAIVIRYLVILPLVLLYIVAS